MENLKLLNKNEILKNRINIILAESKGLINNENYQNYMEIQAIYSKIFSYYLMHNVNLKKYDDLIHNSNLDFGVNIRSPYHIASYLDLDYIFIRNFIFVEKLSLDVINYFKNKLIKKDYSIDKTSLDIVKNSYKEIIKDNYVKKEYKSVNNVCYDLMTPENIINSNKLVLIIQYGKNNYISNNDYLNNYKNKIALLNDIVKKLELEINTKLGIEVKVLIRNYVGV